MNISVVIPCFKVKAHILSVIESIKEPVKNIIIVDDACPEQTGAYVKSQNIDPRVTVLIHEKNKGVGGATMTGYLHAVRTGADIVVKLDGDGQMDSSLIPILIQPILDSRADYTKGNRFFDLEDLSSMPLIRRVGNVGLSFITKISSGYWKIMDPTNGFTAISSKLILALPLEKISKRYFFESDMLFRLGTLSAVVEDIPMDIKYGDETSNLSWKKSLLEFPFLHLNRFFKRIVYNYYLRDFTAASVELLLGLFLFFGGSVFGLYKWWQYSQLNIGAPIGTVFFAAIPVILGFQLLLAWLTFDISSTPQSAISPKLNLKALLKKRTLNK